MLALAPTSAAVELGIGGWQPDNRKTAMSRRWGLFLNDARGYLIHH
jgi:hypothetical protein